jgi:hypothetical protein
MRRVIRKTDKRHAFLPARWRVTIASLRSGGQVKVELRSKSGERPALVYRFGPYQLDTARNELHKLERDPNVQRAIEKTLQKRGLDSESKNYFVQRLWEFFESTDPADEKRQLQAMRILGRGFIAEKVEGDKPEELTIHGFDEGLKRMGLDDESLRQAGFEPYS